MKLVLPFEVTVGFSLMHLRVSHVWGLGLVITDHLSQFKAEKRVS
jgi:hypothetical protein